MTVLEAAQCTLADVLEQHGLVLRWTKSLAPAHFLAQALRPSVAAIYVFPSSAPLHAAHRRTGARTQARVEIAPGACLLRGSAARHQWTLALPPLLAPREAIAPSKDEARTREFAVLVDRGFDLDADDEVFDFEVHAGDSRLVRLSRQEPA